MILTIVKSAGGKKFRGWVNEELLRRTMNGPQRARLRPPLSIRHIAFFANSTRESEISVKGVLFLTKHADFTHERMHPETSTTNLLRPASLLSFYFSEELEVRPWRPEGEAKSTPTGLREVTRGQREAKGRPVVRKMLLKLQDQWFTRTPACSCQFPEGHNNKEFHEHPSFAANLLALKIGMYARSPSLN